MSGKEIADDICAKVEEAGGEVGPATREIIEAVADEIHKMFTVPREQQFLALLDTLRERATEMNDAPLARRLRLLGMLYDIDLVGVEESVEDVTFDVTDDATLVMNVRLKRSIEMVHMVMNVDG